MSAIDWSLDGLLLPAPITNTGLSDLDAVLGGGPRPGQLWVVRGRRRVGRSILACQWAMRAGLSGLQTVLDPGFGEGRRAAARMVSGLSRVPLSRLRCGSMSEAEASRAAVAAERLRDAPLLICRVGHEAPPVLVLDQPDPSVPPSRARPGSWWLVTVDDDHPRRPAWVDVADVVLALERPSDPAEDDGEIDILIERHADGPTGRITAAFVGYRATIEDFETRQPSYSALP